MNICKKCGDTAKPNTYKAGYYCYNCGNLGFDDVYSSKEIKEKLNTLEETTTISYCSINTNGSSVYQCDECGGLDILFDFDYCPHCGKKIEKS